MALKKWSSELIDTDDLSSAMDLLWERGWTDGLPVVPPTEKLVAKFLDYVGMEPDEVVCRIADRNRVITAEKVAINAVMAGCLPEYLPVVIAAAECLGTDEFKINHIASTGSLWIMMVVNGPIVKQIELNAGMYCFGAGPRANGTISRAISLLLSNCAEAKIGGIQRGVWGYSGRFNCCVGENEDVDWGPTLSELQGFGSETNTVSIKEVQEGRTQIRCNFTTPEGLLKTMAGFWPNVGGKDLLFLPPQFVEIFKKAGVSREDVRRYLRENISYSVAELKRRGAYHSLDSGELTGVWPEVQPGDEQKIVYPFREKTQAGEHLGGLGPKEAEDVRKPDIIPVVAGGDAGLQVYVVPGTSDWPVITRPIKTR